MKVSKQLFQQATMAFDKWHLMPFTRRAEVILNMGKSLPNDLKAPFEYQYHYTTQTVSGCQMLVSPTGETNELYTQGRGVCILMVESEDNACQPSAIAFLASLLLSGNSVILCSYCHCLNQYVEQMVQQDEAWQHLLQVAQPSQYSTLIQHNIGHLAYLGTMEGAAKINHMLSLREGPIAQMTVEVDFQQGPTALDDKLALRFVTERVRTINVTAVGGNATLLELGSAGQ